MILILGGTGYVGQAFQRLLRQRQVDHSVVSRSKYNYTDRDSLVQLIKTVKPEFLINAAGYTGKPNVDACEIHKAECLAGNAVLPGTIGAACQLTDLPWGHVSSGCIYTGRRTDGSGFTETDPPNFCFRTNNSSFYSGCKQLGEEVLAGYDNVFQWRLRIPFSHVDGARNYLSKLMRYDRLLEAENSISHLDEFAQCCLDCWQQRVPFGTYNVTNTGAVSTREVVEIIKRELNVGKSFTFFDDEAQFMATAAKTPRSNCVMNNSKLRSVGIQITDVHDAIARSLRQWQPATVAAPAQARAGAIQ